jgi:hypothetical protein
MRVASTIVIERAIMTETRMSIEMATARVMIDLVCVTTMTTIKTFIVLIDTPRSETMSMVMITRYGVTIMVTDGRERSTRAVEMTIMIERSAITTDKRMSIERSMGSTLEMDEIRVVVERSTTKTTKAVEISIREGKKEATRGFSERV